MNREERRAQRSTERAGPLGSLFALALQRHQAGRLVEAERLYQEILAVDPKHYDALHLLGVVAHQTGRNDLAVEMIGKAIAINNRVSTFHNNIGEAYRALGRQDEAITHFRRAVHLEPEFLGAYLNLGNALKQQGKLAEAITQYRWTLVLNQDFADGHANLGVALVDQGKLDEAVSHYERAIALRPDFIAAHMNLGIARQHQGRLDDATTQYRRALALQPNYVLGHMNLGDALLEQGQPEEAGGCYERAIRISIGSVGPNESNVGPLEAIQRLSSLKRPLYPVEDKCVMSLVRVQCWRNPPAAWPQVCDAALPLDGMCAASRYELLVRKAIGQWMTGDLAGLAATLEQSVAVDQAVEFFNPNVKNSRAYAGFLRNLLAYAQANPTMRSAASALPALPVIGDSHGLAYDGVTVALDGASHVARAHLVMGGKAFHLADEKPNQYKWRLDRIISELPEGSRAVCSFGEIDCRLDEGILPHYRKVGGDLETLVDGLVERFVAHVGKTAASKKLQLMFLNVPAPNFPALNPQHKNLTDDDRALLTRIVGAFNRTLERAATSHGYRVIDVNKVSAGAHGGSGARHLDDYHLKPDVLAEALG